MKLPVSVVLPVLNEATNLPEALRSVSWADEVVVIDSGSTDATRDIAQAAGARLVDFHYDGGPQKKKAWTVATQTFRNEWLLFLDADERVTPALRDEIESAIRNPEFEALALDREFIFMERSLRCFRPNWNVRLFRYGSVEMEDLGLHDLPGTGDNEIHEHFVPTGRLDFLEAPLLHHDYRGIGPWFDRHNKYATWEAHLYAKLRREPIGVSPWELLRMDAFRRKRVARQIWVRLPARPALRFLIWYFLRGGFRDGRVGLLFCYLMSTYELMVSLKLRELEQ